MEVFIYLLTRNRNGKKKKQKTKTYYKVNGSFLYTTDLRDPGWELLNGWVPLKLEMESCN